MQTVNTPFQSTLPHGSDNFFFCFAIRSMHFNPRSLTGATIRYRAANSVKREFQSTLPHGSGGGVNSSVAVDNNISIHAPSRERLYILDQTGLLRSNFNPRSLTGATAAR